MAQTKNDKGDEFICPLTADYMSEPVMAMDGHFYEKYAIEHWFKENSTSPITRERISLSVVPCYYFNNKMKEFYNSHPDLKPIDKTLLLDHKFSQFRVNDVPKYLAILEEMIELSKIRRSSSDIVQIFKNVSFINFLIDHKSDYSSKDGLTLLHYVCKYGTLEMINKMISNKFDLDNNNNYDSLAAIHILCGSDTQLSQDEQLTALQLLLSHKIDLEIEDANHWRPIHYICSSKTKFTELNQLKAIKMLLDAGASVTTNSFNFNVHGPLKKVSDLSETNLTAKYYLQAVQLLINAEAAERKIDLNEPVNEPEPESKPNDWIEVKRSNSKQKTNVVNTDVLNYSLFISKDVQNIQPIHKRKLEKLKK